jgi:ribosomal protein L11 methyltransferase|tara:strand:+ start:3602 stop:4390 length:789 start_codon:yes stop_codon:yes gene_type:complete
VQDAADQPILEPGVGETPLWDNCVTTALFQSDIIQKDIDQALSKSLALDLSCHWEYLEDRDWSQEWKQHFKPKKCGDRLWICPSWMDPPDPKAINLHLDPGLAFGTGSHPTTHLCLNWLDRQDLENKVVIDFGCGSGILGIAALLLGAKKVIAVDNDPQALISSQNNAGLNGIAETQLITYLPHQVPLDIKADLVVANILAEPLIELAPILCAMSHDNCHLCLAGLLEAQIEDVAAPYSKEFKFLIPTIKSEWALLEAIKIK